MPKNTQFQPGRSGNPQTMFKPGNCYRWRPGESGNSAGRASKCPRSAQVVRAALIDEGATAECGSGTLDGASVALGELTTTAKAEAVASPPRPGRAVAPPTSPTAPTPTLDPRLDPNERTKGSALYRLNNRPDRPTNTREIGRYIVVDNHKRINLTDWHNNRLRRK